MELLKVVCCLIVYIATQVSSRPLSDQDELEPSCWRVRGTGFKLCLEEEAEDPTIIEKRTPLTVLQQLLSYPLPGKDFDNLNRDYPYKSRPKFFPAQKGSSADTFVHKRPFDSISYNTGLGGFK